MTIYNFRPTFHVPGADVPKPYDVVLQVVNGYWVDLVVDLLNHEAARACKAYFILVCVERVIYPTEMAAARAYRAVHPVAQCWDCMDLKGTAGIHPCACSKRQAIGGRGTAVTGAPVLRKLARGYMRARFGCLHHCTRRRAA